MFDFSFSKGQHLVDCVCIQKPNSDWSGYYLDRVFHEIWWYRPDWEVRENILEEGNGELVLYFCQEIYMDYYESGLTLMDFYLL